ncbi:hypothetical protein GGS24DRAFT_439621 [Hypoxylon argillaceum]|nr:hypothetical protein GGS24DRAFT_439621 [Hypoxylon argillaceum]KAI1157177.1 hypothetical protein F4825DRAFT_400952 [Nemania diffusa]
MTSKATHKPETDGSSWGKQAANSKPNSEAGSKPAIEWSFWSDQVVNGQLNPIHLALGVRGYHIQSEVLRIPNSQGIFSPGPPRLQVYEGQALVIACGIVAFFAVLDSFISYMLYKMGGLTAPVAAIIVSLFSVVVALMYYALRFPPQRSPGYVFEDWR